MQHSLQVSKEIQDVLRLSIRDLVEDQEGGPCPMNPTIPRLFLANAVSWSYLGCHYGPRALAGTGPQVTPNAS